MTYDIAIVGAGIAGASLAAAIGNRARVLLIEGEDRPGYHATGRSAAFWSETYGGPGVQPLTTASGPALRDGGYLDPLGAVHIGRSVDGAAVAALLAEFAGTPVTLAAVDPHPLIPGLRSDWTLGVEEPTCSYIDVAKLHGDYLAQARRSGTTVESGTRLARAVRRAGAWRIDAEDGRTFAATVIVNAAGGWADDVAVRSGVAPIGITPYRRTMVQLLTDPAAPADLPFVIDISGGFYFKPEAGGRLWLSPHDEHPVEAHDVAAEEIDVAIAIDRLQKAVDWRIVRVERRWAGLRSFAPDRLPVYGMAEPGFFWFAGQGGFGIQTAPAAARLAAALLLDGGIEPGIDADLYAPERLAPS